ncbi:hypothetical protein [Oceanobacillus salinisoli]|uniref:hypothetical protein n=1 Tax=Oceanobacillus salinisoli TaxID=2678611 RepID=UPI0012E29A81|nr:hypothetical protein [Oceanobacillus salinisoli]
MRKDELKDSVYFAWYLAMMKHEILLGWGDKSKAVHFDQIVMNFGSGGSLQDFIRGLKQHGYFYYNEYWMVWAEEIKDLLSIYIRMPKDFLFVSLQYGLNESYSYEFYRLMNRIGPDEFVDVLGIDHKKFEEYKRKNREFPKPIQHLGNNPLWTVGQAEEFRRVLQLDRIYDLKKVEKYITREVESKKNGYSSDGCDNLNEDFVYDDIMINSKINWSYRQNLRFAHYLIKRSNVNSETPIPDIYQFLAEAHITKGEWGKAKRNLEKAKLDYELENKEDLKGYFLYTDTLIDLAYVYCKLQINTTTCKDLLKKVVDYIHHEDFNFAMEAVHSLDKGTDSFIRWFESEKCGTFM